MGRWQFIFDNGACCNTGFDVFFSDRPETLQKAKAICGGCRVQAECLDLFLDQDHGVFGGTTPNERRTLRGELRAAS